MTSFISDVTTRHDTRRFSPSGGSIIWAWKTSPVPGGAFGTRSDVLTVLQISSNAARCSKSSQVSQDSQLRFFKSAESCCCPTLRLHPTEPHHRTGRARCRTAKHHGHGLNQSCRQRIEVWVQKCINSEFKSLQDHSQQDPCLFQRLAASEDCSEPLLGRFESSHAVTRQSKTHKKNRCPSRWRILFHSLSS